MQYFEYALVAIATGVLLWLTSRLPMGYRMVIIASVLPGPLIGALGIYKFGRTCVPSAQKRSLLSGLCFLSVGIGCTVAGINRYPDQVGFVSAIGIALLGLYVVWMLRLMQKSGPTAATS